MHVAEQAPEEAKQLLPVERASASHVLRDRGVGHSDEVHDLVRSHGCLEGGRDVPHQVPNLQWRRYPPSDVVLRTPATNRALDRPPEHLSGTGTRTTMHRSGEPEG